MQTVQGLLIEAMLLVVILSALPLATSMFVGLVISVLQAATQIQEQTLSFVPKLLAVMIVMYLCGPWMVAKLSFFSSNIMEGVVIASRLR